MSDKPSSKKDGPGKKKDDGGPRTDGGPARRAGGGAGPAQPEQAQTAARGGYPEQGRNEPARKSRGTAESKQVDQGQGAQDETSARGAGLRDVEDEAPRERGGMARGGPAHPGGRKSQDDPPQPTPRPPRR
jgi:hypothetical protein